MTYEISANEDIKDAINSIDKRLSLLESVFKKLAEIDMRLDILEFNSNSPVKPSISEKLYTMEHNLNSIIEFLSSLNQYKSGENRNVDR